ncbi:hypothetical protein DUNSADRAFT_17541 [Dunaliella salina]|uniref:Uncharacterized protein n=1 Tax=Dunaliella salina TaxID=3046 RepID=A0ABQ7H014_DUNSA|nr:hypothetical protein DUNSADRAFT_17541 [Dunaliella salina]|eukprot:KAF5840194.1 hypothetical protein DUNSADRAFT_17541 [Dunaliella salina]
MAALHSKVFQASGPHGLPPTTAWNQCNVLSTRWHLKRCSKGHAVPSASSSKSVELELAALRADLRELRQILESPLQTAVQAESDLAKENGAIFSGPTPSTQRDTLATAISQAREHISSPSLVDMLAKNLESVTAHLAEATLVATGSGTRNEAHTGKTSPSKRGRGRPRKTSSSVQEQGKDLEFGLPALIADSCTAFASLPDTFAHPAHFARALFALGKLSWQAVQLMAVLSAGTPQQGSEASMGIKVSLLSGLQALMASAPEGVLQGSVGAATPQRQALIERTGGHDEIRSDDAAFAGARSLGRQIGEEGKNLDAATVQRVGQMVAALDEREGPSGIAFCQAAWELMLPGIQCFWSLEHQMDGAAAFLHHMASARRADGAASRSSSSSGSTSGNALVSIPTSITCPSPMGTPSGDRNTSKSTGSPTNDGPGVAEQGRLASANQPRGPRTLSPAFSSLLPAGILQDLSPEARALWLRVCCDTFAAPVHRLKAERARALAAQYTLQPPITAMHRSDLSCTSHPSSDKTLLQDTRNSPAQTSSSGGSSSSSSGSTPAAAAMVSFPDGAATPFQDGATVSFPDGLAARRLVLAAAAFNRCCRAGMRHKDCFVVTQVRTCF